MNVSVIIINYNTFNLTCGCIESVLKFTSGLSYEVILVDNASTECSPDLFAEKYPSIKLIKSSTNSGFTAGNNLGIEHATGDIILLLNSDVVLTENSILSCYNILKNDSSIGVVTCMLKFPDGTIQKQCQKFPSIKLTLIELFRLHKLIPVARRGKLLGGPFFDHLTDADCESVWGTFFMFPKAILNQFENHKLPGNFFMYSEDIMWCFLIKKAGYRIFYNASTSVFHHWQGSAPQDFLLAKLKNEYCFVKKYFGWVYAKTIVLLKAILYFSARMDYSPQISRIYFTLFLKGQHA